MGIRIVSGQAGPENAGKPGKAENVEKSKSRKRWETGKWEVEKAGKAGKAVNHQKIEKK